MAKINGVLGPIDTADLGFWEGRRFWRTEVSAAVDEWAGGRAFGRDWRYPITSGYRPGES